MTKPKRQYKRYSSEFKREALLRASEEGMTDKAVCDELGAWAGNWSLRTLRDLRDRMDYGLVTEYAIVTPVEQRPWNNDANSGAMIAMSDELESLQQQADAIKAEIEMLQKGKGSLDQALGEFDHQARRVSDALVRVGTNADLELQLKSLDRNTKLTLDDIAKNRIRRDQLIQKLTAIEEKIGRININLR